MKKRNVWKMIVSSALVLLPILFGVIVWNKIPEQVAIHWGLDGVADGFGGRFVAVVVLPAILFVLHWLCIFFTRWDNKKTEQSEKVLGIMYWIVPAISLYASGLMYAAIFGMDFDMLAFTTVIVGVLLALVGNYMPKCKRNRTMGIKLKWTLESEENWNYTHRLAGKVWVIAGVAMTPLVFFPMRVAIAGMFVLLFVAMAVPMIASYVYYKKQLREGTLPEQVHAPQKRKVGKVTGIVMPVLILVVVGVILFTGDITLHYGEECAEIEMTYYNDASIAYSEIEAVEYRDDFAKGTRAMGYGSPRLSMGAFRNEEFGNYTLYAYTQCDAAVVLTVNGKRVVINGRNAEETMAIYEALTERVGG